MVEATVELSESNGVGETVTDGISNINYGSDDSPNLTPATYPITAGENSFEKFIRLHVDLINDSNQIDNIQIWKSAGNYVTGEIIKTYLTTSGYTAVTYSQPTQSTSSKATIDMPTADPASANLGISGSLSGTITTDDSYSDYWVSQLQTTGSTPAGDVNQKTFTIQYDEQ